MKGLNQTECKIRPKFLQTHSKRSLHLYRYLAIHQTAPRPMSRATRALVNRGGWEDSIAWPATKVSQQHPRDLPQRCGHGSLVSCARPNRQHQLSRRRDRARTTDEW